VKQPPPARDLRPCAGARGDVIKSWRIKLWFHGRVVAS